MKLTEQELDENLKALLKMGWIILYYDVKNDREIYGSTQLGQEMYYAYTHWTGDRYDDKLTDHTTPIITREKSETYKNDLLMNKCLVERTDWSVVGTTEHPKQVYSATPNGHKLFQTWAYYQDIKKLKKIQDRKNLGNTLKKIGKGLINMLQTMQKANQPPPKKTPKKKGKQKKKNSDLNVPDNPLPTDFWGNTKKNRGFWNV